MNRFCALLLPVALLTAAPMDPSEDTAMTAEGVVRHLYDLITFEAGAPPDWDEVRGLFLDEAVVVLRTSRDGSTVFSLEGWVEDFVSFAARDDVVAAGFSERIVRTSSLEYGDIAHVLVLYESHIPGSDRTPRPGVDSFQLARRPDGWRIVSIVNELPTEDRPVPEALLEESR